METAQTSLREDIEAAVAETEAAAEAEIVTAPEQEPEAEAAPEQAPEPEAEAEQEPRPRRRNARGQFLADEGHPDDESKYPNLTDDRIAKAPESWRPGAREGWDALPDHVKREAHRRELDIQTGQQSSAAHRDLAERFEKTVAPYAPIIAAQGASDPVEAVAGLLQTAAVLQTGTQQQKAERLTDIFTAYGVDLETFDTVLTARLSGKQSETTPDPVQRLLDERLKPFEQTLSALQQRLGTEQQQQQAQAGQKIEAFKATAEFYEDVRADMADLVDLATARGRPITLEQAYETACRMHPEISGIIAARKAPDTSKKRALADSVLNGRQSGVSAPPAGDGSIRSDILASIRALEGE